MSCTTCDLFSEILGWLVFEDFLKKNQFFESALFDLGLKKFSTKIFGDFQNKKKNFKKLYGPFLWMEFNFLEAKVTSRRQFTFHY